jgi:hypothetical protein
VTRELLRRAWAAGLGPPDLDADLTIDVDSTVVETYGLAKQGGGFAYTGVRGYHPLIASLADTGELLHARLRGGKAASGRGAATFIGETIRRVRDAGATGKAHVARRLGVLRRRGGRRVPSPRRGVLDHRPQERRDSTGDRRDSRRRVAADPVLAGRRRRRRRNHLQRVHRQAQDHLPVDCPPRTPHPWLPTRPGRRVQLPRDHHDRTGPLLAVEADHRRHAIVEHTIADLNTTPDSRTCHPAGSPPTPPGSRSLGLPTTSPAGPPTPPASAGSPTKTLRLTVISAPARLITSGRRLRLRLPSRWPWADHITTALVIIRAIEPAPD